MTTQARTRGAVASGPGSRERILDAAQELIARYGTTGMSLQLLADQVGLHKSTLFHHFADKQELLEAVTHRFMAEVVQRLEPLSADDPPDLEHFVRVAGDLDDYFAAHPRTALFVLRSILGPNEPTRADGLSSETLALFGQLSGWLDRARDAGVIRRLSLRQAIVNLMGIALFYPALMDQAHDDLPFDARSPRERASRKRELGDLLRRALAP